jgi:hypothetical protein
VLTPRMVRRKKSRRLKPPNSHRAANNCKSASSSPSTSWPSPSNQGIPRPGPIGGGTGPQQRGNPRSEYAPPAIGVVPLYPIAALTTPAFVWTPRTFSRQQRNSTDSPCRCW